MKIVILLALISFGVSAEPNMKLSKGATACKTVKTLGYAERIKLGEPVLESQRLEASNQCTTLDNVKPVTAFDIGVTAKVEFYVLGRLDVYYANARDLVK